MTKEKKKDLGICVRCKKNKATIEYAEGTLAVVHGFVEHICKECFDKMQKATPLYKKTRQKTKKEVLRLIDELPSLIKFPEIREELKQKIEGLK